MSSALKIIEPRAGERWGEGFPNGRDPRPGPQGLARVIHLDDRFSRLLSKEDWAALPAAVRARFSKKVARGQSVFYRGIVVSTRMNRWGRALAALARVIGAPLPLDADNEGAAAGVMVTENANGVGQCWSRTYCRPHQDHGRSGAGVPQVIHSTKGFGGSTGLQEHIGGGITIDLKLRVKGDVLQFVSDRFRVQLGALSVALPRWLSPGQMVVGHDDVGEGQFFFTLDLNHPVLGELLHQRILFQDEKGGM